MRILTDKRLKELKCSVLPYNRAIQSFVMLNGSDESGFNGGECVLALDESGFQYKKAQLIPPVSSENLPQFSDNAWHFGYVSYDYKNHFEQLDSCHPDHLQFPEIHFFKPALILKLQGTGYSVLDNKVGAQAEEIEAVLREGSFSYSEQKDPEPIRIKARLSKNEYMERVQKVKTAIREGQLYELNFCMEFYAENTVLDPHAVYQRLNAISPAPFSAFCRLGDKYLISSSPERFLKKTGNRLISQPIKGTRKRSGDPEEDRQFKDELRSNEKEQAENVMIVDLVRNDLSRIAERGSVNVDELFGIYSFPHVHQMISTVSCTLKPETSFADILKATFPMGSMTGAPKIRAMQLIEHYEETKRGLYSGALGYISPDGDFDFSVVIRTILYDASKKYLSFMVGSAITNLSDPEAEYEECLLKAKGLMEALNATFEK
jgi:para-aminobenzoate synthetase component 1